MKTIGILFILVVGAALAATLSTKVARLDWPRPQQRAELDVVGSAPTKAPGTEVVVEPPVHVGVRESTTLVAVAIPREVALVRSPLSQYLARVAVNAGSKVSAGDEIIWLDDEEARRALARQVQQEASLVQRIKEVRANHALAKDTLARTERLAAAKNVTASDLLRAKLESEAATARVSALEADSTSAKQERMRLEYLVSKHVCRAAISGVVTEVLRRPGEWVEQGDLIARLESIELELKAYLPQSLASRLVDYRALAQLEGRDVDLRVLAVYPRINEAGLQTVTFLLPLEAEISNSQAVTLQLMPREGQP